MKSYDSRHSEEKIIPKLEKFIDDNKDDEFFVYYGMRSGHGPFNTPIRFRNQTQAGMLGEMIMEADEIVGRIMARLEAHGIADDTLVMFMSDNGPNSSADNINEAFGHNQRRLDLPKGSIVLPGGKNGHDEGGNRTPFLRRYPNRFPARNIYDPKVPVSTVDIYATLAELIEYDLETFSDTYRDRPTRMEKSKVGPPWGAARLLLVDGKNTCLRLAEGELFPP